MRRLWFCVIAGFAIIFTTSAQDNASTARQGPLEGMVFVHIPAGSFVMGSPEDEIDRSSEEGPQHRVTLDAFEMMTVEVTQAMWQEVMGTNPSQFTSTTDLPVENVSWDDIQEFLASMNQRYPGCGYRLPTEAEWEYACRAGTTTRFYSGNDDSDLSDAGWYSGNSDETTHPVGLKEPSAWDLYDMHGNVWECCNDLYDPGYYLNSPDHNPQGPASGRSRVLRGGSCGDSSGHCRAAIRRGSRPSYRCNSFGFRIVRSVQ